MRHLNAADLSALWSWFRSFAAGKRDVLPQSSRCSVTSIVTDPDPPACKTPGLNVQPDPPVVAPRCSVSTLHRIEEDRAPGGVNLVALLSGVCKCYLATPTQDRGQLGTRCRPRSRCRPRCKRMYLVGVAARAARFADTAVSGPATRHVSQQAHSPMHAPCRQTTYVKHVRQTLRQLAAHLGTKEDASGDHQSHTVSMGATRFCIGLNFDSGICG